MVVMCKKADAVLQVLKGKAEDLGALALCQNVLLFFARRFERKWVNGSIIWQRGDH